MGLAESAGLRTLAEERLTVPTDKGANAGLKVASLVGGMVAGADSIDDMALLRHGGMGRIFRRGYAPSTLGAFLRAFTFGHVRQLDAVASRFLTVLVGFTRLLAAPAGVAASRTSTADGRPDGRQEYALVDVDDTIIDGLPPRQAGRRVRVLQGPGGRLREATVLGEGRGGAGEVERDDRKHQPGGVRGEHPGGQVCECGVLEIGVDLLDDRVVPVGLVSFDRVSRFATSVVVKKVWKRHRSNRVSWPADASRR